MFRKGEPSRKRLLRFSFPCFGRAFCWSLVCVVLPGSEVAVDLAVWKPSKKLPELSRVRVSENVFVGHNSPYMKSLFAAFLDGLYISIRDVIGNNGADYVDLMARYSSEGFVQLLGNFGVSEVMWQRRSQNSRLFANSNFSCLSISSVHQLWLSFKFKIGLPRSSTSFIDRATNVNRQVGPHHSFITSLNLVGYPFHCVRRTSFLNMSFKAFSIVRQPILRFPSISWLGSHTHPIGRSHSQPERH